LEREAEIRKVKMEKTANTFQLEAGGERDSY
jgi:hypothetical protein